MLRCESFLPKWRRQFPKNHLGNKSLEMSANGTAKGKQTQKFAKQMGQ